METTIVSPFRAQILATHKKMQVLKLREYIYNYLLKFEDRTEADAYIIASKFPTYRIAEKDGFGDKDINYVNGRLEEIEKLEGELYKLVSEY